MQSGQTLFMHTKFQNLEVLQEKVIVTVEPEQRFLAVLTRGRHRSNEDRMRTE